MPSEANAMLPDLMKYLLFIFSYLLPLMLFRLDAALVRHGARRTSTPSKQFKIFTVFETPANLESILPV